jgi:hypothetical protein
MLAIGEERKVMHRIKNAALRRLQPVPRVRKGAGDNQDIE